VTQPTYVLTRRAAMDLRDIRAFSRAQWGAATAQRYMADLYRVLARIAEIPELGEARQYRSAPFLMIPARQHVIVYDRVPVGVVVLTVLHQARDIEGIIARQGPAFLKVIMALRS
jgi:plasmid stabilization system protein ParE